MAPAAKSTEYLTLDALLAADDTVFEDVDVPEWGGKVKVRSITKGEHQDLRRRATSKGEINMDIYELLLLKMAVVVPELSGEDAKELKKKKAGVVERLIGRILEVSDLREEASAEADAAFRD